MNQNLSSYRIFYTVANTGNISKAAKELYISQPAISKSIQKLEESVGCKLFSRSSRGVVLTDEGKLLYEHVSEAFETLTMGEEKLKRSIRARCRTLKNRCQLHALQISASALPERIYPAEPAYFHFHLLPVHQ